MGFDYRIDSCSDVSREPHPLPWLNERPAGRFARALADAASADEPAVDDERRAALLRLLADGRRCASGETARAIVHALRAALLEALQVGDDPAWTRVYAVVREIDATCAGPAPARARLRAFLVENADLGRRTDARPEAGAPRRSVLPRAGL